MSTDLIQRLRASAAEWLPTSDHTLRAHNLLEEAAGALDRLEAQLRAAKTIVHCKDEQAAHIRREYGDLRAKAADVQGERDANAILTAEVERLQSELTARHQRQHDAEALAGEYLMQRDDARAEVEALRRGEFVCQRCGLRKDAEQSGPAPF